MKRLIKLIAVFSLIFVAACARAQMSMPLVPGPMLSNETDVIVTVPLTPETRMEATARQMGDAVGAEMLAVWPLASIGVICYVFRDDAGDAEALVARLTSDPRVVTVEPVREYATSAPTYRDELLPIQDAMHALRVPEAHDRTRGAGVSIAVIDTGVDTSHPDLINRDLAYRDFVEMDGSRDGERHGTAIAAVIGADASNGAGMVGIAPEATLLPLRACWEDESSGSGRCNSFTLARALNFALIEGAEIVNLSLGGPPDPLLERLVTEALADDRVVIAAGGAGDPFPASMPGVIAVSDTPRSGHVTAPGRDILSATPGGGYDFFSGSSMSAAHVSGLAALHLASRGSAIDVEVLAGTTCGLVAGACN